MTRSSLLSALVPLSLAACGGGVKPGVGGAREGESCVDAACATGLVCAQDATCQAEGALGTTLEDGDCSATVECAYGLVCDADNACAPAGGPGTGAAGDACDADEDCQAGHFCDETGACADVGIPWWAGGDCPADVEGEDFYPLFDVPDLPVSGQIDFFALPFPNDARLDTSGRPDLSGFPTPGDVAPALDATLAAVEGGFAGWGRNPTVYFRFSRPQDLGSLTAGTTDATVWMASLDEDADDYGFLDLQFHTRRSRGKYICQNWLAVSVDDGQPLLPDHTYAVWVTKGVTSDDGVSAVRDNGFKVMVQEERPEDLNLATAWDRYAPFREYVAREGLDMDQVAGAAVFTTGDPSSRVRRFRETTGAAEVELTVTDLVKCDDGVASPCDDGVARACGADPDGWDELHGRLAMPRYTGDDGALVYDATTQKPVVQGMDEVCFALTVPEGGDARGFPVALALPDVGGTFRDTVDGGLAGDLAARGVATLTVDLPGHGERGDGYADPANPPAWLGRRLQAIADVSALERLVQEWSLTEAESPTGAMLRFDPDGIWFVGVGEGAAAGASYLAWSLDARGGVLGNPYGYMIHAFADQNAPEDLERGLMAALADSNLDRWHPALNLVQLLFEAGDPVNDARYVVRESRTVAKHLLVVEGVDDAEVPPTARAAVLRASGLPVAGTVLDDHGLSTTSLPATENLSTDDGRRTGAIVQVQAGHDALYEAASVERAGAFVASGASGAAPTIE